TGILTESTSGAPNAGTAGSITLSARELRMAGGPAISATTQGTGPGGAILITAGEVIALDGADTGILTDSTSLQPGAGSAGSITILAGELRLTGGAVVSATTQGPGPGGGIDLQAQNIIALDGAGTGVRTESASSAPNAGTAGNVTLSANELTLTNGAQISTRAASADGGDITAAVGVIVLLRDSRITTSVGTGEGAGGNIVTVGPVFVILDSSAIQANAFGGPGGNILIVTENFVASADSIVEASSQLGIAGTISISAPETDLSAGVAVLTEKLMNAAARLAKQCGARGGRTLASFVGKGRGALPAQPGPAMIAHYLGAAGAKLGSRPQEAPGTQAAAIPIRATAGGKAPVTAWRAGGALLVPGTLQIACDS
ncbi:MAG: hypothetical protein ACE5GS_16185, partial [Kiloniellaceae bacterium]